MPPGYVTISHSNGTNIYFCSAAGAQSVIDMHPNAKIHTHRTDLRQRMTTDRPVVEGAGKATTDKNIAEAKAVAAEVMGVVAAGNYFGVIVHCEHGCERTPLVAAILLKLFGQVTTTAEALQLIQALWDDRDDGNLSGYVEAYLNYMRDTKQWE